MLSVVMLRVLVPSDVAPPSVAALLFLEIFRAKNNKKISCRYFPASFRDRAFIFQQPSMANNQKEILEKEKKKFSMIQNFFSS
jgi:hypothetical protein